MIEKSEREEVMNKIAFSERAKWIFIIGIVAIGVGFTTKNVISSPTECSEQEMASLRRNTTGKTLW